MKVNLSSESIFYTLQGEGKFVGYPSIFIRLSGCNLRCSWKNPDGSLTQCDTPHTSFNPERNMTEISDILQTVKDNEPFCDHIVITGGEPYLQKSVVSLINQLQDLGHTITVETNGTIYRETKADFISISPKLSNSGMDDKYSTGHNDKRLNYEEMANFVKNHNCQFKFVVNNQRDISEIFEIKHEMLQLTGIDISDNIWLMPQGTHEDQFKQKAEWLWEVCKANGWKYTPRLHIDVYGQKLGV